MVCPSPGCVNSEVKLSGHSHFPSSPRIIAVISIALIGLIQRRDAEAEGGAGLKQTRGEITGSLTLQGPQWAVVCGKSVTEKQNLIIDIICYLRSVRSYREEITCPSLVTQ